MNIALPILLLLFGGMSFWVLNESSLKWYFKTACISAFCLFTVIFWTAIHTFLGWPALENDMPERGVIHWVIIKEPNKFTNFDGRIYVLLESPKKTNFNFLTKFFGYSKEKNEPRLHGLEYSRKLHEQLEKTIMPKLRRGQAVAGEFEKKGGDVGREGKSKIKSKGDGSESQEQEWHFHELLPSEIQGKPNQ